MNRDALFGYLLGISLILVGTVLLTRSVAASMIVGGVIVIGFTRWVAGHDFRR